MWCGVGMEWRGEVGLGITFAGGMADCWFCGHDDDSADGCMWQGKCRFRLDVLYVVDIQK